MRILFLIGYFNDNNGGHFHSLHHIANEIATQHDVQIVSVGSPFETIVNTNKNYYKHIDFNGKNLFNLFKVLNNIKQEINPEAVHFFDKHIYVLYQKLVFNNKAKFFVHVCGGQNPHNFPHVNYLILFSIENKIWFESQKKFSKTKIHLIPNRVHAIKLDLERQSIIKNPVFSFVRISRIGTYYQKSLLASINLINKLTQDGIECKLYIIGNVEDVFVLNTLKNSVLPNVDVVFLIEKKYTSEASQMLYLADAVIATGRSIMEAMSLGLPVLTPLKNIDLPTLVTKDNFETLFFTNFSERNFLKDKDENDIYLEIISLIKNQELQKSFGIESKIYFKKNFDLKSVIQEYNGMYRRANENREKKFVFKNLYFLLLSIYKFLILHKKSKDV